MAGEEPGASWALREGGGMRGLGASPGRGCPEGAKGSWRCGVGGAEGEKGGARPPRGTGPGRWSAQGPREPGQGRSGGLRGCPGRVPAAPGWQWKGRGGAGRREGTGVRGWAAPEKVRPGTRAAEAWVGGCCAESGAPRVAVSPRPARRRVRGRALPSGSLSGAPGADARRAFPGKWRPLRRSFGQSRVPALRGKE